MGSIWGTHLRAATFGESHGPAVGVVVEGVPAGLALSAKLVQADLDRRRPGASPLTSPRREPDAVEILSGVAGGRTLGSPIALLVRNQDARSGDYGELAQVFRPGHADWSYFQKYGLPPQPGGGRASGRETVGRVAAGAVARALLGHHGVAIRAYTVQVGTIRGERVDPDFAETHPCAPPTPSGPRPWCGGADRPGRGDLPGRGWWNWWPGGSRRPGRAGLRQAGRLPGGALFSIGGSRGWRSAPVRGGRPPGQPEQRPGRRLRFPEQPRRRFLGGISTGQPILARLAVKPTPSIARPQRTVDLAGPPREIAIHGRHDPCLCPRVAPVAEAMAALVLADALLAQAALQGVLP